jgi:hypothetical protein
MQHQIIPKAWGRARDFVQCNNHVGGSGTTTRQGRWPKGLRRRPKEGAQQIGKTGQRIKRFFNL